MGCWRPVVVLVVACYLFVGCVVFVVVDHYCRLRLVRSVFVRCVLFVVVCRVAGVD